MPWKVFLHEEFDPEFEQLGAEVQDELLARVRLLQQFGPMLGRPWADTLAGSRHANMKELRFDAGGGVWRVAFAFDLMRQAVLLVAGDKAGTGSRRFYRALIRKADDRFDTWVREEKDDGGKRGRQAGATARRAARQDRGPRR